MDEHEQFMLRAIELASLGIGSVSPNPCVGCVVVHENKIIGEGWHRKFGNPHAEANALTAVRDSDLLSQSTLYVTLEPCSHFGKTPPCADLLIEKKIKKVVIAMEDPNPLVAGKGIAKLRNAGIEVIVGIRQKNASEVNRRFLTAFKYHRPYVILKWAQTNDGFMADSKRKPVWITNEYSRQLVHKWRAEEDAIMVGSETALIDNPRLNVRTWSGKNPIRVVIDRNLRLPQSISLFDGTQQTICYNLVSSLEKENVSFVQLDETKFFNHLFSDLFSRGIHSVIVEGGPILLSKIIELNWWDEARIFSSPKKIIDGIYAPSINGQLVAASEIQGDRLEIFKKK